MLNSTLEKEFIEVKHKSRNNSYHDVKPIKTGQTNIKATLIGVEIKVSSIIRYFLFHLSYVLFAKTWVLHIADSLLTTWKQAVLKWVQRVKFLR